MKQNSRKKSNCAKPAFSLAQAMVLMFMVGSLLVFSASAINTTKYNQNGEAQYDYIQTAEGDYFKNKLEKNDDDEEDSRHIINLANFDFGNDYDSLQIKVYSIEEITYDTCINTCSDDDKDCKNPCATDAICGKDLDKCRYDSDKNTYYILSRIKDVQYDENNLIWDSATSGKGNLPEVSKSMELKVGRVND